MTTHQLIYTSCRRGINGVNDGQQVFSYDADFPTQQLAAMAPTMTYRGPDLPTGVPLTEALVPTYPKAFTYALLGHQADLALNTYLGKDYMGPTGRFGNFLSHHVLVEEPPGHPAEFIGSPTFRSSMDFDEVNNPDPPPHLPPPELVRGGVVTRESVRVFLGADGRWRQFTRLVACMLAGPASQKRVIVSDLPEHVEQWIGALGYVVPSRCAADLSFSTYEYNPVRGDWRIVGAIADGTQYDPAASTAYVFDFVTGTMPDRDLPGDFADFLEIGLLIASDSLAAFHSYVESTFPAYRVSDETLYGAFALYQLADGEFGADAFHAACTMLDVHGDDAKRGEFLRAALSCPQSVSLVTDPHTQPVLLDFVNRTARGWSALLELTFDAEGSLLDCADGQAATHVMWSNFHEQMVRTYGTELSAVYRELASYPRLDELLGLFTTSLRERGPEGSAKSQFAQVIAVLRSPQDYPRFIDAYYAHATTPRDREHLLTFIMEHKVAFSAAGTLVTEAVSDLTYGPLPPGQEAFVKQVWRWVDSIHLDLRQCGRLWHLVTGLVVTAAPTPEKLAAAVAWAVQTARQEGLGPVPDDPSFVDWVVPPLFRGAETGSRLQATLTDLGFRVGEPLVEVLWGLAFRRFDKRTWFKVAECVFAYGDERLLGQFAEACKKLSNRELADLDRAAKIRYAKDPVRTRDWESLYAVTQETAIRSVRAWIGKRGEGRDRAEG